MKKNSKLISIGIMTGTSADSADLAAIEVNKQDRLLHTSSYPFPKNLQKKIFSAQTGRMGFVEVAKLTEEYSHWLAGCCESFVKKFKLNSRNYFFSIHGQTIWHEPAKFSVQILNPAVIAARTNHSVVYDFRKADIALGGQGAPLVPLAHRIFSEKLRNKKKTVSIHNIGGISNFTLISKNKLLAFDTGPGNALIDLAMKQEFNKTFDRYGEKALNCLDQIDWKKILKLANHPYFKKAPPKSTGKELFNSSFLNLFKTKKEVLVAEATAFSAYTMAKAYHDFCKGGLKPEVIYFCGGGVFNPALIQLFAYCLAELGMKNIEIKMLPEKSFPSQYVEAMAFARLGFEALKSRPVSLKAVTGARKDAVGASVFMAEDFQKILRALI